MFRWLKKLKQKKIEYQQRANQIIQLTNDYLGINTDVPHTLTYDLFTPIGKMKTAKNPNVLAQRIRRMDVDVWYSHFNDCDYAIAWNTVTTRPVILVSDDLNAYSTRYAMLHSLYRILINLKWHPHVDLYQNPFLKKYLMKHNNYYCKSRLPDKIKDNVWHDVFA